MGVSAQLGPCSDVAMLKSRVADVSAGYGALKRLDILTAVHEGRRQAICFMRLQTPEQEEALMRSLGVGRFDGEIVFTVDLQMPPAFDDGGPSSVWADSELL
ncbi:MAG TPA: RNA-binding protein [Ottowia sp.]|uniref:RNA-binding protein n=1 Tax=Ottowia sp. TaxID=1898956 RepID=UPI002BC501F3|nr:RNA-binding protein [Ottowia sp.]HMN22160.1 RNA-binding protein [Ottowia sp.]